MKTKKGTRRPKEVILLRYWENDPMRQQWEENVDAILMEHCRVRIENTCRLVRYGETEFKDESKKQDLGNNVGGAPLTEIGNTSWSGVGERAKRHLEMWIWSQREELGLG